MFFIPCDSWKTLFFLRVCCYCEIFSTAILSFSLKQVFFQPSLLAFFETIVLKEVQILRILSPQCSANNGEVLIPKFQNKAMYTKFILDKHSQLTYFMITFFTLFLFFDLCFDFLTFVKNSRPLWMHVFTQ